jgi:uncharacterized coiled-coil protein SlyX
MNSVIQQRKANPVVLVALTLACFGLWPTARAVTPPPDGGYADGNTAEGSNALFSLTTGVKNTANGYLALFSNTTGQLNTAIGSQALYTNTTGSTNTAAGFDALFHNITGSDNTAAGYLALFHTRGGGGNTAVGSQALMSNTNGTGNTATGAGALIENTTGFGNAAFGGALVHNTTGSLNTAIGDSALINNITGYANTAIGNEALGENTTGRNNTALGFQAGFGVTTASRVICIGSAGTDVNDSCFIGNIRGIQTQNADAIPVVIDSAGQLGTMSSSQRFKKEIKPIDSASEVMLELKPVTFHYKSDPAGTPQFGLIAEEVAKVDPNLVVRDADGEIYSVRYEAVNAMLLNEFLKEHRTVQELKSTVAKQEVAITDLTASLKEQASQIQKVSALLELSNSVPQMASNDR